MKKKIAAVFLQYLYFVVGLVVMTFGIYLTILARSLGVSPWDVFHLGVSNYLPLSLGLITQLVGVAVIGISLFLGIRPKLGTILNMYITGLLINFLLDNHILPVPQTRAMAFGYLFCGVLINGLGTAIYITANLGAGPRDSLMMGLHKKTGYRVAGVRTFTEILAVVTGYFLGGPFGIGTVIYSLCIGPSVEASLKIISHVKRGKLFSRLRYELSQPAVVKR